MLGDHIHIATPYREMLSACGLDRVETALNWIEGDVAAWSRTTDTLRIACPNGGPGFFLKRYYYPTWRHRLRGTFRGTFCNRHRAQAEYHLLDTMCQLGIPAVRPIAYGARRVGHFVAASFLITEEVPGAQNLTTFASDVRAGRQPLTPAQRRAIVVELAARIAQMHNVGFSHGQLYWRNILFRFGAAGAPEFFFLDARPRRGRRWFARRSERYLYELGHAAASAIPFVGMTDRLLFLKTYVRARRLETDLRPIVTLVDRLARRWERHERQRILMNERFEAWNRQLRREREAGQSMVLGAGS